MIAGVNQASGTRPVRPLGACRRVQTQKDVTEGLQLDRRLILITRDEDQTIVSETEGGIELRFSIGI